MQKCFYSIVTVAVKMQQLKLYIFELIVFSYHVYTGLY